MVSLPAGVFNPYSGVKTSILLMDKALAKQTNEILFVKIDNDGYNLGAQRTAVKGSQLEEAVNLLDQFKSGGPLSEAEMAHAVSKKEIATNVGYNLSGERYKTQVIHDSDYEIVELGKIMELNFGERITKKENAGTLYPVYGGGGESFRTDNYNREDEFVISRFAMAEECIRFVKGKFWMMDSGGTIKIKNECERQISKSYLGLLLSENQDLVYKCARGGAQKNLKKEQFYEIQIPLPPLSVQEEIVAEIEDYQRIINGAKAVVNNYKPKIDVDPKWEMVELGEVCDNLQYGSSKKSNTTGDIACLRMGNIQNGEIDWSDLKYAPENEEIEKYILKPGDVLFNRTNSPIHVGKTGIYRGGRKAVFAGYLIRLNYKKGLILGDFLNYCLNTKQAKEFCQRVKTDGINQSNINAKILSTFRIPLPGITTQGQIVAQIEKEQELVHANKQLIEIFEQKIKDRIAKVWGE